MKKEKKKRSKGKIIVIVLLIIGILGLGAYMGIRYLADQRIVDKPKAILEEELPIIASKDSKFYDVFKKSDKVNVLLLGVNQNLTDTIMLVSYDKKKDHIDLISIPRDTEYHREGYDSVAERKINAAYKGNPLNTAKAVSDILEGMPINYYAVIDYKGVEKIVDTMGGVPMNLPKAIRYRDPKDTPPLIIDIPAGEQILDGKNAVKFLRYRKGYADGDIGRIKAQQEFMNSALNQAISFKLPKIIKVAVKNLDTDMKIGTATNLALKAKNMKEGSMTTYLLPGIPPTGAPWYWTPDEEKIEEMLEIIYGLKKEKTVEEDTDGGEQTTDNIEEQN